MACQDLLPKSVEGEARERVPLDLAIHCDQQSITLFRQDSVQSVETI
jgi:hypothetical protein